ncbi:MAG: tRNA (adenosine(37)-N6)-dimethylallyltransferase MiaA [Campylobacterales bacterium]|nr:tRNA (adenosine(37)-N6)-dimethylallyltransferase MiaA [Campylobacterales bacterium]
MKELAILGSTASGKSDLALQIVQEHNGIILSLDSLSIYKEIDIASAKPPKEELALIKHFGVDEIYLNEEFNVVKFFQFYKNAKEYALKNDKNLVIVGGSSFYLKMLIEGISYTPKVTEDIQTDIEKHLQDLPNAYKLLKEKDPQLDLKENDKYRIEKALTIFLATNTAPTLWQKENHQDPIIKDLQIFNIEIPRDKLLEKVTLRTEKMFQMGIIDEAAFLEKKYGLNHNPLASIGLKECYDYLNGKITRSKTIDLVITHTMQLAKRQKTFNNNQFNNIISHPNQELYQKIKRHIFC